MPADSNDWHESLFPSLRSTLVFTPTDVAFALSRDGAGVDMAEVCTSIEARKWAGKGSAHLCVAHADYAFRVRLARNEHRDATSRNEMICELRYAQLAHEAGIGLRCPFFGIVRFHERDERLLSCWPLGMPLVVPPDPEPAAALRAELRAALETLATRLVALDACKPANWVTVGGTLRAIDFETHLCFPTQTDAQRAAAAGFVPVMLALFEMCTELNFSAGVVTAQHTIEGLASELHAAMCSLLDAYSGRYESFASVAFGFTDVSYALLGVLVKYTEFCIYDFEGAKPAAALLRRMRFAFEKSSHVHHKYAASVVNDARSCRELTRPFATLMASLVDGAEDRPTRHDAVTAFYESVGAVWRPNEPSRKRRFECV